MVVGTGNSASGEEAFIWQSKSGMRNLRDVLITDYGLDLTGWTLYRTQAISGNGRAICGYGRNPSGYYVEAWLVLLDPLVLNWLRASSGDWDAPENWDFCHPATSMTEVYIQPNLGLTVSGPIGPTTVKDLRIGPPTTGLVTLNLQASGTLSVTGVTTIASGGRIAGNGTLNTQGIFNSGEIDLGSGGLQISGGTIANNGVIRGSGAVFNPLQNNLNGEIRVGTADRMVFYGTPNSNTGMIEVFGGEIEFKQGLNNQVSTGTIFVSDAILRFSGSGLSNSGSLGVSFGTTNVSWEDQQQCRRKDRPLRQQ